MSWCSILYIIYFRLVAWSTETSKTDLEDTYFSQVLSGTRSILLNISILWSLYAGAIRPLLLSYLETFQNGRVRCDILLSFQPLYDIVVTAILINGKAHTHMCTLPCFFISIAKPTENMASNLESWSRGKGASAFRSKFGNTTPLGSTDLLQTCIKHRNWCNVGLRSWEILSYFSHVFSLDICLRCNS